MSKLLLYPLSFLSSFSQSYPVVVTQLAGLLLGTLVLALLCRARRQYASRHLTQTREIMRSVARHEAKGKVAA